MVAARGRLMQALPPGGAMTAVQATEAEVGPLLAGREDQLGVAAVNGPRSIVLSGDQDAVAEIAAMIATWGRKTKKLTVSHAFHSARMDPMLGEFRRVAESVSYRSPEIPLVSTLTGRLAGDELRDPDYWVRQVRQAVRFGDGIRAMRENGVTAFAEIGPGATLTAQGLELLTEDDDQGIMAAMLPEQRPEPESVVAAAGELHAYGVAVDWGALLAGAGARRVALPTYPFERKRYWPRRVTAADKPTGPSDGFWTAVDAGDGRRLADNLGLEDESQRTSLATLLPALSSWRRRADQEAQLGRWLYRISWQPHAVSTATAPAGTWIVVEPADHEDNSLVAGCVEALREHRADVVRIAAGAGTDRAELAAMIKAALADHPGACGVLSTLASDERPLPGRQSVTSGIAATLALVQALSDVPTAPPVWVVTSGAVAAGPFDTVSSPAQAQLWGLGAVVRLESPERWGGVIDMPAVPGKRARGQLAAILGAPSGQDQLAVRQAGVFTRRIARATRPDPGGQWRPSGTTLVCGGTGALGRTVARWLARNGAEHLTLVSRRGAEAPGFSELREDLARLGAQVTVIACDASDKEALREAVASLPPQYPLTAVFHSAGELNDGIVDTLTPERLDEVLGSKVRVALNLHEVTAGHDLTAFVLFSSSPARSARPVRPATPRPTRTSTRSLSTSAQKGGPPRRSRGVSGTAPAWPTARVPGTDCGSSG